MIKKNSRAFWRTWSMMTHEAISVKLCTIEFRLLQKYKDQKFYDAYVGDGTVMRILSASSQWEKKTNST